MGKTLTEKVTWVGKVDWELKKFHGDEYSTHHGSSYNSYLIRDTEIHQTDKPGMEGTKKIPWQKPPRYP